MCYPGAPVIRSEWCSMPIANLWKAVLIQTLLSVNMAATPTSPKGPDYCNVQGSPYQCRSPQENNQHIFCKCNEYKCHLLSANMTKSRQFVLDWHNKFRNMIALKQETEKAAYGKPPPQAADMNALSWNYAMEDSANCNAKKCVAGLQHDDCNASPQYRDGAGQNLYTSTTSGGVSCRKPGGGTLEGCDENTMNRWEILAHAAIRNWYNELKDVPNEALFGKFVSQPGLMLGHMTQVLWAKTTDVGCGIAADDKEQSFYVTCNYHPAGNFDNEPVYTTGPGASKCPPGRTAGQTTGYAGLCGTAALPPEPPMDFFVSSSSSSSSSGSGPPGSSPGQSSRQEEDDDEDDDEDEEWKRSRGRSRRKKKSSATKKSPMKILSSLLTGVFVLNGIFF